MSNVATSAPQEPDPHPGRKSLAEVGEALKESLSLLTEPFPPTGFKEWANVCEALGTGVMSLILRKGGIHEGRGGFEFKHRNFFLFPTWFHTQGDKLTWEAPNPERFVFPPEEGRTSVDIDYLCRLEKVWKVTDWDKVASLAPHHVWNEDMVRERFVYDDESCLNVALVRTYRLPYRWSIPYSKSYGGCRSWVTLPEPNSGMVAAAERVVSNAEFEATKAAVSRLLD